MGYEGGSGTATPSGVDPGHLARLTLMARAGDPEAQVGLGCLLSRSSGTAAKRMAVRWFAQAAASGSSQAQYQLGLMLLSGEAGELDTARAMRWLARAAGTGHEAAARFLASHAGRPVLS